MAERLCHRYGPGRLPGADRRDVGAGFALASMGLLATVLWFGGVAVLLATGFAGDRLGWMAGFGLYFLPFAILSAFLTGQFLWRTAYSEHNSHRRGAVLGALAAIVSLLGGAIGFATIVAGFYVVNGLLGLGGTLQFAAILVPIGFVYALLAVGWLVVPLGAFAGWYHERARGADVRSSNGQ